MPALQFYRYLLCCRPDTQLYPRFQAVMQAAGQQVPLEWLHLTLCVIAQAAERDRFLLPRVETVLAGQSLYSFPVNLSRVVIGSHGATARTYGRQNEIQDFYSGLVQLLALAGIEPLYRKSGFHPHVTLGHEACAFALFKIAIEWFPTELLLIESEVGLSRHNVLGRWLLLPPRQPLLPFDAAAAACRLAG